MSLLDDGLEAAIETSSKSRNSFPEGREKKALWIIEAAGKCMWEVF